MHTCTYNEHSLHRMGFKRHDAHWIRQGAQDSNLDEAPIAAPRSDILTEESVDQASETLIEAEVIHLTDHHSDWMRMH